MNASELVQDATHIVRRLRDAGFEALFAGGWVRDRLLLRECHDIDIATSAKPADVQRLFPRTYAVGEAFGVICVLLGESTFQVATFRSDGTYVDGRHPETVRFSSAQEDAFRRDFTINGLFYDPLTETVIDYVGGQTDLSARLLRAIGNPDERFREDRLRLLRAVRFATVLDFELHPETLHAVREHAAAIVEVSPERIREELMRILLHPRRVRGFDLLAETGLLHAVLPEMSALKGCTQPPQFHPEGDVWVHTRLMLSLLPPVVTPALVLGVLFHDIAKPLTRSVDPDGRIRFSGHEKHGAEMTETILTRLRFPRADIDATVSAVANHMSFKDVRNMRPSTLRRFMARSGFEDELELHRVDCSGSHGMLDNHQFLTEQLATFANEPLIPKPLLTGRDLIEAGLTPGPTFKGILDTALSLQMENRLATREQALAWLKSQHTPENPSPTHVP